nr:CpsD/CapB family tyrosine-protein kinase [Gammaproteobacteria bacterium]
ALKDTQVLARLAEATVMLVRWRHTSRELLKEALRQLDEAGVTSVRGFVLSRVRLSKLRNDAYGYYGKYRRYARGLARPHGSSGPDEPPALNRTV